jgi:hypothetical protein
VSQDKRARLRVIPLELSEANQIVSLWHRHHKPSQGHRFSIGCIEEDSGRLCGAAIVGRPVARLAGHPRDVLEVVRLVTDGTKNACSCLYAAAARTGRELGYLSIQTYILEDEHGVTLRASGWICEGSAGGGQWKHTDGKPRRTDQPIGMKTRWRRVLNSSRGQIIFPESSINEQETLYGSS